MPIVMECQEGERGQGTSAVSGRSRTKHFDDSRKRYARSATGETIAETRKAIRNHSHSDWKWPVSNEGLSRARRPSGGSRWSPQQHQSQKGGRKGEIEYKVEGRRASHRVRLTAGRTCGVRAHPHALYRECVLLCNYYCTVQLLHSAIIAQQCNYCNIVCNIVHFD